MTRSLHGAVVSALNVITNSRSAYGGRHNKSCETLITSVATNMTLARVIALTLDIENSHRSLINLLFSPDRSIYEIVIKSRYIDISVRRSR